MKYGWLGLLNTTVWDVPTTNVAVAWPEPIATPSSIILPRFKEPNIGSSDLPHLFLIISAKSSAMTDRNVIATPPPGGGVIVGSIVGSIIPPPEGHPYCPANGLRFGLKFLGLRPNLLSAPSTK